jgi:hypothetical protein
VYFFLIVATAYYDEYQINKNDNENNNDINYDNYYEPYYYYYEEAK